MEKITGTYKIYSSHLATAASITTEEETRATGRQYRDALVEAFEAEGWDIEVELIHGVSGCGDGFQDKHHPEIDRVEYVACKVFEQICC